MNKLSNKTYVKQLLIGISLLVLLTVIITITILYIIPFISPLRIQTKGFIVEVKGKEARLCRYIRKDTDVVTPDYVLGRPVTTIGYNCFYENDTLENVTISNNVRLIGVGAFQDCVNLKSVKAENVVEIKSGSFADDRRLSSVELGSHLEIIGDCAFESCRSLKYIPSQESIKEIEDGAFTESGLTDVGDLTGVKIEGSHVFEKTPWIYNIKEDYVIINGILLKYKGDGNVSVIPDDVTVIEDAYEYSPDRDITIYIPTATTKITGFFFLASEKYTVYIPETVEYIVCMDPYTKAKIITVSGSYAEQYAIDHGMDFEIVDGWEVPEEE